LCESRKQYYMYLFYIDGAAGYIAIRSVLLANNYSGDSNQAE